MIIRTTPTRRDGFSYLAVLIPAFLIGTILIAYLQLVSSQNYASARAQSWNASLVIAESGVEEAFAHLNKTPTNNLASGGWTRSGSIYSKKTYLNSNDYYEVSIDFADPVFPVITSKGFVAPVQNHAH
jgi:Tfp pilus assembly protein PilV